ncbi:cobalt-precorrin-5B (C(1))-methyltransferase CbiD [Porphyromonadaceae bacterium OttesenSCG-928-L07]|nr:cobalt-precorrin-5B (C(1))-methyltransferase CbiD [Porphyromonadaceae bacterium OttesenSCG-928-L07]MDL2252133.1 cobalt-precorrin-5B (C(1))-methyltransferase CbiD [Odoribacter sp. OttesenSCG-928-J03]MDL2330523.1 cobalt-precorrin-5B (C(1))-methyltransferase CbiD [Odoribacter sp. OttesenSCG-928-A06]
MILIFGGTTEGRNAVAVCDEAGKPYYYSTKTAAQKVESANGIRLSGAMNEHEMLCFCNEHKVRLIVDSAHPFAEVLHQNIAFVAEELNIPVIRYERNYPEREKEFLWFDTYGDAVDYLLNNHIASLLALTGVNTLVKLKAYWEKYDCWFRILDRKESLDMVKKQGFPMKRVLFYDERKDEEEVLKQLKPQAIITKESGETGGFKEKVQAAKAQGICVLVVKRPVLSDRFIPVYGNNGLRRQIEKWLPDFFELKTGYTTGTCATAATAAALITLLSGEINDSISVELPNGEGLEIPIWRTKQEEGRVTCSVIKDAGDDPDVTNGLEIRSTVELNRQTDKVNFLQGEGIGVVTLPGLGLEMGGPAINATPRAMITNEVVKILKQYNYQVGLDVTLSVPKGEEIARKTFNPKLGIEGGISIIGTSGIVKPFSSDAFMGAIRREMQVAKALDCTHVVINSGAKSEHFIKELYPDYPQQAFIHYGNFIGETIQMASEFDFEKLTLGLMIGKAVKLAEGALDTHSKKTVMNKAFLIGIAEQLEYSSVVIEKIENITLARELWDIVDEDFLKLLIRKCYEVCKPLFPKGDLNVLLVGEEGKISY